MENPEYEEYEEATSTKGMQVRHRSSLGDNAPDFRGARSGGRGGATKATLMN